MKCPQCDTENRETAKFCDQCGFRLADTVDEDKTIAMPAVPAESENGDEDDEEECTPTESMQPVQENEESAGIEISGETNEIEEEADNVVELEPEPYPGDNEDRQYEPDPDQTIAFSPNMTLPLGDLSGFDEPVEGLVGPDYEKPEANWHDGRTMRMAPIDADGEETRKRDYLASSTAVKSKRGHIIAFIAIAIVAVVGIALFTTYSLEIWGGKSLPDVTGLTEAEATGILQDEGFTVKALQVKSDDTEGLVLVMDPSAGSRAEDGAEIVIHVATARLIPDVTGKTKEEAETLLKESGFENITFDEERSSKKRGTVVRVDPEIGERAKSSDEIHVYTAKPYTVPDITDKYLSDAEAAIEEEGLVPTVEYVYTEDYPEGIIIGTQPAAGIEVQEGSTVSILISRSREAECIALTQSYLAPGNTINKGLYGYEIESIESLTYMGDSTVAYTVMARPFISGFGETVYFSAQLVAGQITWTAGNDIASMS